MHSSLESLQAGKPGGSATPATLAKPASPGTRLLSIDALRGLVMVIMALDHVRDFFHADAALFSPTDLSRTTPVLFLTRWITHYCLPVFMFAAGMGVFFYERSHSRGQLSRFLWTRGLWFVVLELTVMQFAYNFNFSLRFLILLLILWIFGICMLAMAALVYVPMRWLAALSVAVIVLHNCLDGIRAQQFGSAAWAWNLLHQPGVIPVAGKLALVTYTFLPWIAVMAAGFCFGHVFQMEPDVRRRIRLKAWPDIDDCFYRAAGGEPLWRPRAVDAPEVSVVYRALFSQLHQISRLARFFADDAGAGLSGARLV